MAASLRVVEALTVEGCQSRSSTLVSGDPVRRAATAHRASELYSTATNIFFFWSRVSPKFFSSAASAGLSQAAQQLQKQKGAQVFGVVALRSQEETRSVFFFLFPFFGARQRVLLLTADARFCLHIPLPFAVAVAAASEAGASQAQRLQVHQQLLGQAREGDGPWRGHNHAQQPCGRKRREQHARTNGTLHRPLVGRHFRLPPLSSRLATSYETTTILPR